MMNYSKETRSAISIASKGNPDHPGIRLGGLCMAADIPVQVLAEWTGTTRMGVYLWFKGAVGVSKKKLPRIEHITRVLAIALEDGAIPAASLKDTIEVVKQYRRVVE